MPVSQQDWVIASEELFRRLATCQNSPPATGTWSSGDVWRDSKGAEFVCTGSGTPGTWRHITPAMVAADPASGSFPTGYLIVNVAEGALKRHAGALSWEIQGGAGTSSNVGFHGALPVGQRASADQAVATDFASVIGLANELRAALVEKGLIKGGA